MIKENFEFYSNTTATELNQKFEAIFPTWTTIVATIIAVLILMLVLSKLFYNPIKKMVNERRKFIQDNIDNAIKQNEGAAVDREQASKEITEAHLIANSIIADARLKAEKIMKNNIVSAKDESNRIVQSAHKNAAREKELFESQAKEEMIALALEAAKHVIEKKVNIASNRKFVRDFIKNKYLDKENKDDS